MKFNNIKRVFTIICMIAICFSLGACSLSKLSGSNEPAKFIDFSGVEKEYLEAIEKLNWPEDYSLPIKLEGETAEQFQVGYGVTKASMLWECAWEKEWLQTYNSDHDRAERAIKELEKAPGMLYMSQEKCDDATRKYFNEILEKAKLGDPSGFEENLRLNSPE